MKWIRPMVTLMFTLGVTYGFFVDKIEPVAFLVLANSAILWWFASRDREKEKANNT